VLGSVLMIGAHPDDEHTPTLAYFARGRFDARGLRFGDPRRGGQNLLGPEQGDLLGLIRTEELLAARRIDGPSSFHPRHRFRVQQKPPGDSGQVGAGGRSQRPGVDHPPLPPDVIVLCFSGTPRDGHGHHQASALLAGGVLGRRRSQPVPRATQVVEPWQARRVVWNVYGAATGTPGQISIETGDYNPVLGYSYIEIAALSRSMHQSQGMGAPRRRGSATANLVPVAGEAALKDLFDGIVPLGIACRAAAEVGRILAEAGALAGPRATGEGGAPVARSEETAEGSRRSLGAAQARGTDEALALCAGLWLDATTDRADFVPGSTMNVHATALNRSHVPIRLTGIGLGSENPLDVALPFNQPSTQEFTWKVPRTRSTRNLTGWWNLGTAKPTPFRTSRWWARPRTRPCSVHAFTCGWNRGSRAGPSGGQSLRGPAARRADAAGEHCAAGGAGVRGTRAGVSHPADQAGRGGDQGELDGRGGRGAPGGSGRLAR